MVLIAGISGTFAQDLSKDEIKKLKKELENLYKKPEQFKQLKDESNTLEGDITAKNAQIVQKKADIETLNKDIIKKDEAIEYLEEQLRKAKKDHPEVNASKQGRGTGDCIFSVQIGAYKNRDLTQYMDNNPNFGVESDTDGFKKYTLGFFTSYWEAKNWSKYLDSHGAVTYVVGFYKGKRVPDLKDMTQCTF